MSTLTPFSAILAARTRDDNRVDFHVPDDWLQGRTSFGGLISAMAAQAMRDVAGAAWPAEVTLRALQTSFVAPVGAGAVSVVVKVLREGKSVRQVQADVVQAGQTAAVMLGVYAADRESVLAEIHPARPAAAREAESIAPMPFIEGLMPAFLRHFDRRWADGPLPYSGGQGSAISLHMRPIDPAPISGEMLTVLLADMSPTPPVGTLKKLAPSSSVSWALELRPVGAQDPQGWWRADTEALVVGGGYVNQSGRLWTPDGSLAALAYQVVTVFA
ncbi:thioesterase family protein [soil metagenome]